MGPEEFRSREVHKHIKEIRYDADSIRRQMEKLEVPEDWAGQDLEAHSAAVPAEEPPREVPTHVAGGGSDALPKIGDIMEPRADSPGSEEDDIDVEAKFFVAVNVRSGHRKQAPCVGQVWY